MGTSPSGKPIVGRPLATDFSALLKARAGAAHRSRSTARSPGSVSLLRGQGVRRPDVRWRAPQRWSTPAHRACHAVQEAAARPWCGQRFSGSSPRAGVPTSCHRQRVEGCASPARLRRAAEQQAQAGMRAPHPRHCGRAELACGQQDVPAWVVRTTVQAHVACAQHAPARQPAELAAGRRRAASGTHPPEPPVGPGAQVHGGQQRSIREQEGGWRQLGQQRVRLAPLRGGVACGDGPPVRAP